MSDASIKGNQLTESCTNLVELLQNRALHQPEQKYTFLLDGKTETASLTYRQLDAIARSHAVRLQTLGLTGERALLLFSPGLDYLAAFFGCLYAKVIAVPLYPPKLKRNLGKISAIAKDAGATVAIAPTRHLENLEQLCEQAPELKAMHWLSAEVLCGDGEKWQQPPIHPDEVAYLQYTSGSTSTPKGVMVSHANVLYNIEYIHRGFDHDAESVAVTWLPPFHDMGLIDGLLKPLYLGIPSYFMPPAAFIQNPMCWLEAISHYKATHSGGPNFAYDLCASKISKILDRQKTLDLSSWRVAYNGAEPIHKETLERFTKAFEPCGFHADAFCPAYGMAETTLKIATVRSGTTPTFLAVDAGALENNHIVEASTGEGGARTLVGCGFPEFGTKVAIVNPESLTQCQPQEVGEIWVAGLTVARGYWNRPEDTEKTFQAYLSDTREGPFLRTGDLGFLRDGELFITGRLKDLIIIRGRNLYPQDIERTAERSHPSLRLGAIAAFSVKIAGIEQLVIVQEIESRKTPTNSEEIISAIRSRIAIEYEIQAYGVVLIKPGSIPKTTSGKIQRRAACADFLADKLEVVASSILEISDFVEIENRLTRENLLTAELEERQAQLETYLRQQVARVLKVSVFQIPSAQDFSNLGFDSLAVFELKNQLETDLKIALSIEDLFEKLSLAQLTAKILEKLAEAPTIESIQAVSRSHHLPLSFAQERLWFFDQLEPGNPFYNLCGAVRITGQLNAETLRQSIEKIIERHEILRTAFAGGEKAQVQVQVIFDAKSFPLPLIDLSDRSPEKGEIAAQELSAQEAQSPFDLTQPNLLRAKLLRLSEIEHTLLLSAHHIIFDGWSLGVFLREIAAFYEGLSNKNLAAIPPLPIQYADFATWQRQQMQGEILETQLTYWKQQLSGSTAVLNLPTDFSRPAVQSYKGGRQLFELPEHLTEAIRQLSRREKTTVFMTLLAAFKTLLYRYTGQEDILVGSPIASRNSSEIESLIGFFVNTLVLRTDLNGNPTFRELLSRVREVALGAYAHQDVPFEKLVEELQPNRDLSHSPLFQVMFAFQNASEFALELPGLSLNCQQIHSGTANFDLTLELEATATGIRGWFEYSVDLFSPTTIARMAGHFQNLLESIVANSSARLSDLPMLAEAERLQLLFEWNNTGINYSQNGCVHRLFEVQAAKNPDAVAVQFECQSFTYRELNNRANQLAHYLLSFGVKPDAIVGVYIERSLDAIVAILGVLKAGGAYLALDPNYSKERLNFMLEDAGVQVLLTQTQLAANLPAQKITVICLDAEWEKISPQHQSNPDSAVGPENLAYIIYTSGSTGKPKGVMVQHHSLANYTQAASVEYAIEANDRILQFASLSFDVSAEEIYPCLTRGATLVLRENSMSDSISSFLQKCREWEITVLNLPTAYWHEFTAMLSTKTQEFPPSVRLTIIGGEAALPASLDRWQKCVSEKVRLVNAYGPTETTISATWCQLSANISTAKSLPIGRPIPNARTYVLDANLQPVPIGVPGELYIGGAGVARGYINRSELNREKFIPDPFSKVQGVREACAKHSRLYKTGDLVRYLPDGNLVFLDRTDRQVKIRGFRIELGEIESTLSQHPDVQEAVILARDEDSAGKRLIAYLVLNSAVSIDNSARIKNLRSFLQKKLPDYMVPASFMFLEAMPLTPNGKVDFKALPAPETNSSDADFIAPQTLEEQVLAEIWAEVLGLKQVGINDNFFELGGHSLLATQLIAKVRDRFQVELSLRCLFQSPTVASLAVAIAQAKSQQSPEPLISLPAIAPDAQNRYQPFPLNEMQQAYWIGRNSFFEMGNVAIHGYVEIESDELDLERFSLAWERVVERHDMLRAIVLPNGQQQILEKVPAYKIEVLDLRSIDSKVAGEQLEAIRDRLSHQVLPLDRWPLFEICASKINKRRIRLHISIDALCIDGWSFQILFGDLVKFYRNPHTAIAPLQLSFRDCVLTAIALEKSPLYQQSLDYWRTRLKTLPPAPELPLAKQPNSLTQPRFKRWSDRLDFSTWQRLKTRIARASLTPTGLLLAAYAEVLSLWSKTPRFTLNVPRFNRLPLHSQVEEIIGEFASFTLLEIDNSKQESFEVRAKRLQEQLWQDLEHQYVSGVRVLRELAQAQGTTAALMPVVFTIDPQNAPGEDTSIFSLIQELGELVHIIGQTPQVWIDAQFTETAQGLSFSWDAVEELFPPGLIDEMFDAYCRLLQRLANEEETWQKTVQFQQAFTNGIDAPIPDGLLHELFAEKVASRSHEPAVITRDRTLTYEELYRRSNQVAHRLRNLGVRPNQLVAVVMEKGWEQVVAVLGILASGAAYLPVDAALPKERLWYVLDNGEVEIVLTQSQLNQRLKWPKNVRRICLDTEELATESGEALESVQEAEDLAYVIYTSGSTGLPKGVAIAHRGVVNAIAQTNQVFNVVECDRAIAVTALHHDMSVYDIFGILAAGGAIVIPDAAQRLDPAHWAQLMVKERVTIWNSVPPMMEMLLDYAAGRSEVLPECLRWAFLGGDWIPITLPERLRAIVRECRVVSVGGPTETTLWNIWYPVETVDSSWKSIPYGSPIANTRYYILNERLEDCPVWVAGEMCCAGVGLTKGYWRNEEKTRASCLTHPVTGDRLYRTGDLGRFLPDGNIEFLGREDFRLKIRGFRIEAGEIEAALNEHPAVKTSIVTAFGENHSQKRLVGYIVPQQNAAPAVEELRQFLSEKLPDYMVPSTLIILDALPLSANGKVNRKALPEPDAAIPEAKNFVAPRTPIEEILARICCEVLGIEQLSITDNFFELGGNSLLAIQLAAKIREYCQIELPLCEIFAGRSLAVLAENISEAKNKNAAVEEPAIAPVSRSAYRRSLSSLQ
ncbi:amino acid adenylation domain-containing protein [Tychonema sp. LEGE 07199]|uniref:non-ribosomal peptide synthetase n=1 Tax=unclassified Tychonema TaxID=2642144 RepID=UPI001880D729|nr:MULTISPECIES: non-ribosomal peptide synthetase [unclassified Tychonema]MBE9120384.1 amino acid adenylation domain-containing protein [Tychonema sp. LEGE 07199]MBE9130454.1 amino acid adenylation domain-containing protein [Tychonema sp. LEGE 07196]